MTDNPTSLIGNVLTSINDQRPNDGFALVLIGSVARDTATSQSDLDLLVLSSPKLVVPRTPDRLHVQSMSDKEFEERLKSGDDFAAWCVRFGVPIVASESWLSLTSSPAAAVWPDWRLKVPHAARRLTLAASLLDSRDIPAAAEEALYAVTHVGRAILLKNNVFPLSRPEMIHQLRAAGKPALSDLMKTFLYDDPEQRVVRRAIRYTKRLLIQLDRPGIRSFVDERKAFRRRRVETRSSARVRDAKSASRRAPTRRLPRERTAE